MSGRNPSRAPRIFTGLLLAILIATGVFGSAVFSPQPAQAQFVMPVVDAPGDAAAATSAVANTTAATTQVSQKWYDVLRIALTNTAELAILNGAQYFAQKVAYDTANYIASGGNGQKPFFTTDGLGDYLSNTAKDAAGDILGTLSKDPSTFGKFGFNLCAPSDPKVMLNIKLGFLNGLPGMLGGPPAEGAPKPTCAWDTISNNWSQFKGLDSGTLLNNVGVMFQPGQSSLSGAIQVNNAAINLISKEKQAALNSYVAKAGFLDKTSKIGGKVQTPAEIIKEEQKLSLENGWKQGDQTVAISGSALSAGAIGVGVAALKTFTNTLAQAMMKKVFEKGLITLGQILGSESDSTLTFDASPSQGGKAAAELANASLLTPKILSITNYDALTDFAACPQGVPKNPNNCVMDSQFYSAVNLASQGTPLTVRQAVQQGLLNANWPLLPLAHRRNIDQNCYSESYCYSNLVKLRKASILPIGWELAANSTFNDVGHPVTLGEAMSRFDDCPLKADGTLDPSKLPDPLHPWCHLIDPEWVLKYPTEICRQQAPGPTLLSVDSSARAQTCVDQTTCIAQDASGNCIGGYGYCVREKNVWNMDADSCPAAYASCTAFHRTDGATASFLSNTLDAGPCNSQNAGCRQYSQSQNAIPNPGFEDLLDLSVRDWTLSGGAVLSRSGLLAERGLNAVGILSGDTATVPVFSLQPGTPFTLSAGVLQQGPSATPQVGTIKLTLFQPNGQPVNDPTIVTTCAYQPGTPSVSLGIVATNLGYLDASCKFTVPLDATFGRIELSTTASSAGNRTFFDELGLYGASFSASAYDSLLLSGKVQKCASDQAGCTDLVDLSSGALNIIRDPSFESQDPSTSGPSFWNLPTTSAYEKGTLKSFDGVSAVRLDAAGASQDVSGLLGASSYDFSVYTKLDGPTTGNPRALIQLYDASTPAKALAPVTLDPACTLVGTAIRLNLAAGTDYQRSVCSFTTPDGAAFAHVTLLADNGSSAVADAAQLELSVLPSAYHEGYASTAQHAYMKTAPQGLNCTGPNRAPECDAYAPSCRRDEVGCDSYKPDDGGTTIPAVTVAGDACPLECVGYDTFKEEASNFNDARFPLFLIPSSATNCSAAESGCSEFTNVQKLSAGGESREYFTYLRLCAKPDQNAGTFYTWEGNDTLGYQLRSWNLLKSDMVTTAAGSGTSDPTGGIAPCTKLTYDSAGSPVCADDAAGLAAASCLKSDVLFNPDCREFYDVDGNIHYRLYSKTVVVSDACTEYRITKSTQGECAAHGGLWRNGQCNYFTYAPESQSCRSTANDCRAYSGNGSRNVRVAMSSDFETGTTDGWAAAADGAASSDVASSNESVNAGGHSLKVNRATVTKDVFATLRQGKSYVLTFWAKGSGDLDIAFTSPADAAIGAGDQAFTFNRVSGLRAPVTLGTEWRPYQVGPVFVTKSPATGSGDVSKDEQLSFKLTANGVKLFYLDNVVLQEVTDHLYLIQDSWTTPTACDQTPNGDSSPQYMLGCRAYHDHLNKSVSLKSFDRICRPEAVGCEAMYDTRHTSSPFPQTFGAICTLPAACAPGSSVTCACKIAGQTVCQAISGATTCRYDVDDAVPASRVSATGDTVRIPADGIVYLVKDEKYSCDQGNVGCTAMGDKTMNRERTAVQSWQTVYLKNDPAAYSDILCKKTEEYCQAYARDVDGSSAFFKDPELRTCEFRENATGYSGWFKSGSDEPCYASFLQAGTQYGIWKNSDSAYDAWVGKCPTQFDQCKEFVDTQDTSPLHPGGQPYYAIKNDRLDASTCQNRASLTQSPAGATSASACVLFWQTDNLSKTFDAANTYKASDAQNGALVQAVSDSGNDTNVVIRVSRDRQCGQWLDCRSSEAVFNPSSGQFQNVCTSYSLCAQYERIGNTTQCVRYVDSDYSGTTLSPKLYASRDTGWKGLEYTSYAIPNQYPVNELVTMNVGSSATAPELRLVRVLGSCSGAYGSDCGPSADHGSCLGPGNARKCVYPIDDGFKVTGTDAELQLKQAQSKAGYPNTSCRAFPEESSPFPTSVADPGGWNLDAAELNNGDPVLISPSPSFKQANVCQRRIVNGVEVSDCECNYTTAKYGSLTKYFGSDNSDLPLGYCSGGTYDGYECDPLASGTRSKNALSCCAKSGDDDTAFGGLLGGSNGCDDGSQCVRLSKVDRVVGYQGQCLERDFTTPINGRNDQYACLTWRPVGLVGGSRDIYNQNQTAGYFSTPDRRFYCAGEQVPWAVKFEIQPEGSDNHPDTNQFDPVKGPANQDPNNYFGHGIVTNGNPSHALSQNITCEDNDSVPAGAWCVWPTDVTGSYAVKTTTSGGRSVAVTCANAEGTQGACGGGYMCHYNIGDTVGKCVTTNFQYHINSDAIGILGCYEVADGGSYKETYIDYPYIGPALYRQQLQSIYFQMTNDIYRDGDKSHRATNPTNPRNYVEDDCNDDDDDSLISPNGDSHAPITDADVTPTGIEDGKVVSTGRSKGLRYMEESNSWSVDVSNGGGVVVITATFDKNGLLKNIRVSAGDHNDSGTFGINRMGFVFKPGCQEVAQVDQPGEFGATKAFTNAVNPYRDFNGSVATVGMHDTLGQPWAYPNACRPFGAIGSIASVPPTKPWTYVAARGQDDLEQCNVTDYIKGAAYQAQAPETLSAAAQQSGFVGPSPANWAATSLRNLYRQVFGVWQYQKLMPDGSGGTYAAVANDTPVTNPSGTGAYDETSVVDLSALAFRAGLGSVFNTVWVPPRIAAVDTDRCDVGGHCKAGQLDSVTLNGKQKGIILGADGAFSVTAKFYGWASHDAMPIAKRTVLWGDLVLPEPPAKGWYKNQKPYCSPDTSDQNAIGECANASGLTCNDATDCPGNSQCVKGKNGFGDTPGACNPVPYQFDHTYTCSLKDLQSMSLCTGSPEAADNAPCYRLSGASPVCVYRPKVQVTDNWGWCNCTGSACKVSGGAYQDGCSTANPPSNAEPWTEFTGEVRLGPSIADAQAFIPGSGGSTGTTSGGTAVNDSYTTVQGTTYGQHTLLANDTLLGPASQRQVVLVDPPQHGSIPGICDPRGCFTITPEGSLNYTVSGFPNGPFYHGIDTFTYKIVQNGNDSNVATVTINNP